MCFQGGIRTISILRVSRALFLAWSLCGLPDPSTWSPRKTPGSLTSTSNPTCPAQTFSWLDDVLRDVPRVPHVCGASTTYLAAQGVPEPPPCPLPVTRQPAVLLWAPRPVHSSGRPASCSRGVLQGRAGRSPPCPSSQHRVWQGGCSEKLVERMSE